jgi:PKD repeat protein
MIISRPFKLSPLFTFICGVSYFICSCDRSENIEQDPPDAGFSYTSTRGFPVQVQFTNLSVTGMGTATYSWDFGDGSFLTGTGAVVNAPVHIYISPGVYLVKLIQTEAGGTKDTLVMALNLNLTGPSGHSNRINTAAFSFAINTSYITTFSNSSTHANSYLWEFGDGTTSTSASSNVTKNYPAPGTYHVRLTATGSGGTDTCSASITFN